MNTTSPSFGSVSIFRITRNEASSPGRVEYSQHSPSFRLMSPATTADDPKPMKDSSVLNGFFIGLTHAMRRCGPRASSMEQGGHPAFASSTLVGLPPDFPLESISLLYWHR